MAVITRKDILKHRDEILALAKRYGASNVRIFGSVARGDATDESDLDLIVRFEPGRSLFDQGGLLMDLQELLGVKVDLISENGIRDRWRQHLMQEAVPL
ncbi:MAG TPA: nucleotidyltransferase family protein [Phycisphaerae bacterium]|nr:nucleotidyltransferase family protein [Phycisphaerae bacterium]